VALDSDIAAKYLTATVKMKIRALERQLRGRDKKVKAALNNGADNSDCS
jgi:hypothetical protein